MFDLGSAIGSIGGSFVSANAAKKAQQRQINWERERATHAHQWEVEDLKKAGLNPVLSAGGSGATTGGISAPVPDTSGISNAISTAIEASRTKKEIENIDSDTKQKNQNTKLLKAQEKETLATAKQAEANANLAQAQLKAETPKLIQKEKFNTSKTGKVLNYIGMGAEPVGQAIGAITNLGGLAIGTKAVMNSAKGLKETTRHNAVMEQMKKWPKVQVRTHNR